MTFDHDRAFFAPLHASEREDIEWERAGDHLGELLADPDGDFLSEFIGDNSRLAGHMALARLIQRGFISGDPDACEWVDQNNRKLVEAALQDMGD